MVRSTGNLSSIDNVFKSSASFIALSTVYHCAFIRRYYSCCDHNKIWGHEGSRGIH